MKANSNRLVISPSRLHCAREWVIVFYRRLPHVMNMRVLNRAMRDKQIAGDFDSVQGLADRIEVSRSTVSRFFGGKNTSLAVTVKILEALELTFDQVFMEIGPALLARLQADGGGAVHHRDGITVVNADILAWPEASEIRAHFGLPALAAGPAQQALPAGSNEPHRMVRPLG